MINLLDLSFNTKSIFHKHNITMDDNFRFYKNGLFIEFLDMMRELDITKSKETNKKILTQYENDESTLFGLNHYNKKILTQDLLDYVTKKYNLTASGYNVKGPSFALNVDVINKMVPFVTILLQKTSTICNKTTSYGLKHRFERIIGQYVSNGDMIAVMILMGFQIRFDSPNCCFNISNRSIEHMNDLRIGE